MKKERKELSKHFDISTCRVLSLLMKYLIQFWIFYNVLHSHTRYEWLGVCQMWGDGKFSLKLHECFMLKSQTLLFAHILQHIIAGPYLALVNANNPLLLFCPAPLCKHGRKKWTSNSCRSEWNTSTFGEGVRLALDSVFFVVSCLLFLLSRNH